MTPVSGSLVFFLPSPGEGGPSQSERRVSAAFSMPAQFEAWLRVKHGSSPLGALISFQSTIVLSGVQARVTFRSRASWSDPPLEEVAMQLPIVPPGQRMVRPGHSLRGLPREGRLSFGLLDREGRPLGETRDLGPYADGVHEAEIPFSVDTTVVAWVTALDWSERHGPRVRLSGELIFTQGLDVRLDFNPVGARGEALPDGTRVQLIGPGTTLYSAEKVLESSLPGSSWVSIQFIDSEGCPIGEEVLVGRCVVV
jgi:hypothetical protein